MSVAPPSFMVRKHAVPIPQNQDNDFEVWASQQGLSPMQRALLNTSSGGAVRVVDAPTGSGKSFAFQKAVVASSGIKRPGNVLFIAPTRRLTDALAQDLRFQLRKELASRLDGADRASIDGLIDQKVLVWNGGQEPSPGETLRQTRYQQLNVQSSREDASILGMTVFTVVEILEQLMFPRVAKAGSVDEMTYQLLGRFQHIVFDEFHTLDRGSMALAVLVAGMVKHMRQQSRDGFLTDRLPTVTFLSATPVNVEHLLEAADMLPFDPIHQPDGYQRIVEVVVDRQESPSPVARVLHGDVRITFEEAPSLLGLVKNHLSTVRHELSQKRQIVVIYNELSALKRDQGRLGDVDHSELQALINALSLAPEKVLLINSADDRTKYLNGTGSQILLSEESKDLNGAKEPLPLSGVQVANRDTSSFDLLIATSSVEAGVTFRDNQLLFMEPGMTPLSFMQRVGRTARKDVPGTVIVRFDEQVLKTQRFIAGVQRNPHGDWLKILIETAKTLNQKPDGISIGTFQSLMKCLAVGALWSPDGDHEAKETPHYRQMSDGIVLHMRLYWALQTFRLMARFPRNTPQNILDLWAAAPPDVEKLRKALVAVNITLQALPSRGRVSGDSMRKWWLAFQVAVLELRNIGTTVLIEDRDPGGRLRQRPLNLVHAMNKTSLMEHARLETRGSECILVYNGNTDTLYNLENDQGPSAREWDVRDVMDPRTGKACPGEMFKACPSFYHVVTEIGTLLKGQELAMKAFPNKQDSFRMLNGWMNQIGLIVWCPATDLANAITGSIPSMVL